MKVLKFAVAGIIKLGLAVFLGLTFASAANAQKLSPEELETSIAKIAKLVEDNYVFAEKGKKIAAFFLREHAQGKFKNLKDWREFSFVSTKILRDLSGDGHLFVNYDPNQVMELVAEKKVSGEPASDDSFFYGTAAREKNYGFSEIKVIDGNVGYLKLSQINISAKSLPVLLAAMQFVAETGALIIDLRDNSGGGSEIGAVLESFFLPKNTVLLEFKSRNANTETTKTVAWLTAKKYDAPVFIIINKKTASAAEALAFALQAKKRAKIVGEASAGGANMSSWYAVNEYIYASVSTATPVLPGTDLSWEGKGVQPDFVTRPGQEIEFITQTALKK